jgi:hypothetical protein
MKSLSVLQIKANKANTFVPIQQKGFPLRIFQNLVANSKNLKLYNII